MKLVFSSFFAIVYRWLVRSTARHSSWSGSSQFWRMLMGALCDDVSLFCQDCFQWVLLIPKTESWHSFISTATCAVFPTYMVFTFHVPIFMALFEGNRAGPTVPWNYGFCEITAFTTWLHMSSLWRSFLFQGWSLNLYWRFCSSTPASGSKEPLGGS